MDGAICKPVLIYDGECTICVRAADWIRARSGPDAFEFLSCHAEELAERFPRIEKAACLKAMHLVLPDGAVLIGERAMPEILRRLRGYEWAATFLRLPGAAIVSRLFYRWLAKNRHLVSRTVPPQDRG